MSVKNGINGWAGTILRVNLTTGSITKEDTLPKYRPYIGGMGIGYKVIWDEVPLDTDPLGPEQLEEVIFHPDCSVVQALFIYVLADSIQPAVEVIE